MKHRFKKCGISYVVIFLLCFLPLDVEAQLDTKVTLSPRIKLGWTFFSGFNYGIEFNIGLFTIKHDNPEVNVCFAPQYMLANYKGNVHSLITINAVVESDYYRLMLGMGQAFTKWGFHNRNSNRAFGYNIGLALSTESKYTPWIEGNVFALKNGYWEFYGRPYYLSASMFFRPEPYVVYAKK